MNPLTLRPQRLAAGREDAHAWRTFQDPYGQSRSGIDHVLAIIEQQEHPLVPEICDQTWERVLGANLEPKHGGKRGRNEVGVTDRCQINQPDAMLMNLDQLLGHGESDGGLADATGSNDAEKSVARQLFHETANDLRATNQTRQKGGQIVPTPCWRYLGRRGPPLFRERNCCHKAVASTGNIDQIPIAAMAVAQRPPQGGDMDRKIALHNDRARPNAGHQLLLADEFAGVLDQGDQDIKSATAEANGLVAVQQQPLRRKQAKGAERG